MSIGQTGQVQPPHPLWVPSIVLGFLTSPGLACGHPLNLCLSLQSAVPQLDSRGP